MHCGTFVIKDMIKWALGTIIQFFIGKRFYIAAYRALKHGSTNMDVLIVLGTSASYFYSVWAVLYGASTGFLSPTYFETGAMIISFVLLGKYLEAVAKGRTSDAIKKLVELAPSTAILLGKDAGTRLDQTVYHFNHFNRFLCWLNTDICVDCSISSLFYYN